MAARKGTGSHISLLKYTSVNSVHGEIHWVWCLITWHCIEVELHFGLWFASCISLLLYGVRYRSFSPKYPQKETPKTDLSKMTYTPPIPTQNIRLEAKLFCRHFHCSAQPCQWSSSSQKLPHLLPYLRASLISPPPLLQIASDRETEQWETRAASRISAARTKQNCVRIKEIVANTKC